MNIYLISQNKNNGYDTYDSFVVYARDEYSARTIFPLDKDEDIYGPWVKNIEDIQVKYIGSCDRVTEEGVILRSFNAA